MLHVWVLIKKEFRGYFNSPAAYIFITVFLVLTGWLYMRSLFLVNQADMRNYFNIIPWVFLLLIPAVGMKSWAEEKKMGTVEVLMVWPVKDWEVVVGKFIAGLLFVIVALAGSLTLPIILSYIGNPDYGVIIGSYLGSILMASSFLAIGVWASSLTDNQIVAFIIGVIVVFTLFIIGDDSILFFAPKFLTGFLRNLSLGYHFNSISRGVIDSRDIIYYFSVIGFFLYLNGKSLESRKWK